MEYNPQICDERHRRLDARLLQLEHIVKGNGEDGLVTKMAVNDRSVLAVVKELASLAHMVGRIAENQDKTHSQLNRLLGALVLAQVLFVPIVMYGIQRLFGAL